MQLILESANTSYISAPANFFRIIITFFLIPSLGLAGTIDENFTDDFCVAPKANEIHENSISAGKNPLHKNSLEAILNRGTLRVLIEKKDDGCVISKIEKELLEKFTVEYDLKIDWVYFNSWNLVLELAKGNGDIIAGQRQNISEKKNAYINYTNAWANSDYKIVQRSDNSRIRKLGDLAGRHIAAYRVSPVWDHLVELSKNQIGMTLEEIPNYISHKKTMERVKTGQYDLAVIDSLFLNKYPISKNKLQTSLSLTNNSSMAWAVNRNSKDLHKVLNQYLNKQHILHGIGSVHTDDLTLIKQRGVIRVITDAKPSHYYLKNGKLNGFEYELLRAYAKKNQLRVNVVLANSQEEMFQLLLEGKGDVIAASLPSGLLSKNKSIQYTRPYDYASPIIIGRSKDPQIIDVRGLIGKRISLSRDNPYWDYMLGLKERGYDFDLIEEDTDVATVLLKVAFGIYDFTIIGGHQIKLNRISEMGLKSHFALSEPIAHRWALRAKNKQLYNNLNMFIKSEYRGVEYNVLHAKYFEQPLESESLENGLVKVNSLSPYDDETKYYAEKYGFDWRLIIALMFQESQFNPNANSYAGAKGVMQLTKLTAELLGVRDTKNVEKSIDAGVRYLSQLREKFDNSILIDDRMWFAVASYNSGYTRLKKARALAEKMGLDKNKWFQNVELAMLLMAKPYEKNGKKIRNCRCGQTVVYVREIRTRYFNYIRLTETQQLAMSSTSRSLKPSIN